MVWKWREEEKEDIYSQMVVMVVVSSEHPDLAHILCMTRR